MEDRVETIAALAGRARFWSRVMAGMALTTALLVAVNMYLFVGNQRLSREVAERQQFIAQTNQIQGVAREIVAALANLATKNNDEQLKQLLTSHGITYSVPPPGTTGSGRK